MGPPLQNAAPTARRGFSLVELLVASTILLVVVSASMRAHVAARRGTDSAAELQEAGRALRSARALLASAGVVDIVDAGGDVAPGGLLAVPARLEGQRVTYEVLDAAAAPEGRPVPVRISATWLGTRREPRALELVDAFR